MKLLFILTLFVLVLLICCSRVERFTDERFEKVLKQEEKHFFRFMNEKDGKAYDGYRAPTQSKIRKIQSKDIEGTGKKINLRSAIITGIVLNNLRPTYEECNGVKNSKKCRRDKKQQIGRILGDYIKYRRKKLKRGERKGFRNDSKAIYLHYSKDNDE